MLESRRMTIDQGKERKEKEFMTNGMDDDDKRTTVELGNVNTKKVFKFKYFSSVTYA